MNEDDIINSLRDEGFKSLFIHTDPPGAYYPEHTHSGESCHFVLDGEMTVIMGAKTRIFKKGERFDVPAGELHSAKAGESGCRYIIGEK